MKLPYLEMATRFDEDLDDLSKYISRQNVKFNPYNPTYIFQINSIERSIDVFEFLNINVVDMMKENTDKLVSNFKSLSDSEDPHHLEIIVRTLKEQLWEGIKDDVQNKVAMISGQERERLNEALHCYFEGCWYSAIAMSVYALESRLMCLMKIEKPGKDFSEYTFGKLIQEYLESVGQYNTVIPEKYKKILKPCNEYRIFSVHPKGESINKSDAMIVLNLTFKFLLDKDINKRLQAQQS